MFSWSAPEMASKSMMGAEPIGRPGITGAKPSLAALFVVKQSRLGFPLAQMIH